MEQLFSPLRHQTHALLAQFSSLSKRILNIERSEEKTRLALTDSDLQGRDVLSIICENNEIELLEHKYVEKLAD